MSRVAVLGSYVEQSPMTESVFNTTSSDGIRFVAPGVAQTDGGTLYFSTAQLLAQCTDRPEQAVAIRQAVTDLLLSLRKRGVDI